MKIIGVEHSKGQFVPEGGTESVNYDNMIVYCVSNHGLKANSEFVGQSCESYKLRTKDFYESFPGIAMVSDVIGLDIEALYNKYGKVGSLRLIK